MIIPESKAVIYNVGVSPWSTKLTEGRRKKCSKKFAATVLCSDLGPRTSDNFSCSVALRSTVLGNSHSISTMNLNLANLNAAENNS